MSYYGGTPSKKRYGRPTAKKLYEREQNIERHVCLELEDFEKTVGPMISAVNLFRKGKWRYKGNGEEIEPCDKFGFLGEFHPQCEGSGRKKDAGKADRRQFLPYKF